MKMTRRGFLSTGAAVAATYLTAAERFRGGRGHGDVRLCDGERA